MVIRPYISSDLPKLHRIDRACFPPGVSYTLVELRSYVESKQCLTLVTETMNGGVVGFITVKLARKKTRLMNSISVIGHIITIDLLPKYRSKGFGSKLLNQAEAWLKKNGAQEVVLETATDNEPAILFYNKHGYKHSKRIKRYYANDTDAYRMTKRLGS